MAAYIVATVRITDVSRFKEYSAAIAGVSEAHGGEPVVKGVITDCLEGSAPNDERIVVTRFPDEASARAYITDPAYQAGKAKREGAAEVCMRLIVD